MHENVSDSVLRQAFKIKITYFFWSFYPHMLLLTDAYLHKFVAKVYFSGNGIASLNTFTKKILNLHTTCSARVLLVYEKEPDPLNISNINLKFIKCL